MEFCGNYDDAVAHFGHKLVKHSRVGVIYYFFGNLVHIGGVFGVVHSDRNGRVGFVLGRRYLRKAYYSFIVIEVQLFLIYIKAAEVFAAAAVQNGYPAAAVPFGYYKCRLVLGADRCDTACNGHKSILRF